MKRVRQKICLKKFSQKKFFEKIWSVYFLRKASDWMNLWYEFFKNSDK